MARDMGVEIKYVANSHAHIDHILGVGAIAKRPKVVTLPDGTDTIAIRTMGMVSMSYDHRIVDGHDAARFIQQLKRLLEHPALIFLD